MQISIRFKDSCATGNRKVFLAVAAILLVALVAPFPARAALEKSSFHIGVLLFGDNRLDTFAGLQEGLAKHGKEEGITYVYDIRNAKGKRADLAGLAAQIIAAKPDMAIAGGGIEADALKIASAGTKIPVVFLAASSAVDRGLVKSMLKPGGNLTGIDTNDTALTAKRLWYIKKILPGAKRVRIFNVLDIKSSVESVKVAQEATLKLGLELTVVDVADEIELEKAVAETSKENTDVVLITPVATLDKEMLRLFVPLQVEKKIPVMGYNRSTLENGAFASYAASRFDCGRQAARQVHTIFHGQSPEETPVETPEKIEFVINRWMVNTLGLKLSNQVWKLADEIVDKPF